MGFIANTTGGILTGINNKFDSITGIAKGILCLPQLFTSGQGGIMSALQRQAAGVVYGMSQLVTSIVTRTLNQLVGKLGKELAVLNAFLQDIRQSITLIKTFITSLDDKAKSTFDFLKDQENCKFVAAELGRCIIGQVTGAVTKKLAKDLTGGTKDIGTEVNKISKSLFAPDKSIEQYVKRSNYFISKSAAQFKL